MTDAKAMHYLIASYHRQTVNCKDVHTSQYINHLAINTLDLEV